MQMDVECGMVVTAKGSIPEPISPIEAALQAHLKPMKEALEKFAKQDEKIKNIEESTTITQEQFESIFSDGIIPSKEEYDSNNKTVETPQTPETEVLQAKNKEMDSNIPEPIRPETAKLQARIKELEEALDEEKAKNSKLEEQIANRTQTESDEFVKMKRRNETLESLNQANEKRLKTYESIFGTEEQVSKEKQFSITERIIFCSALLGCGLREEDISQMQMAKLISKFSGDKPEPIRTTINRMNKKQKALVEVAEKAKQEEDAGAREIIWRVEGEKYNGITNAALNVYKYLHAAVKGQTIGAKVYCCKQAMENINQAYYLMERKLINRTDLQPKGEFELPPEEI